MIKTWNERCELHPDHQNGMVSERMIQARMQEEIDDLRTALEQPEQQAEPCVGKDPRCPCQDGDACHYRDCGDTKAFPVPPPHRKPVTDDMVHRAMLALNTASEGELEPTVDEMRAALEAAYSIGETT